MKIVEFSTGRSSYSCLVCGDKTNLKEVAFKRQHRKYGSIIGFTICNKCIKTMSEQLIEGHEEDEIQP